MINKMSRKVRLLFAFGYLLVSATAFLHVEVPGIPDFLLGATEGVGLGLMIGGAHKAKEIEKQMR